MSVRVMFSGRTDTAGAGVLSGTVRLTLPLGAADVIEVVASNGATIKVHRPRSPASKPIPTGTALGLLIADPSGIGLFTGIAGTPGLA